MLELRGCTALVTGASAGLGEIFARELARRGVGRLILVARRRDRLEALAAALAPAQVVLECVDLADQAAVGALIARHPRVDVLVNNAGLGGGGPFLATELGVTEHMVSLNCVTPTRLMRAWLPGMVERGWGGVLNVGSVAGQVPQPTAAIYGGTKAYLNQLNESLRLELRGSGVHLTNLAPGPIRTEFFGVGYPGFREPPSWLFLPAERVAREGLEGLLANRDIVTPAFWVRWPLALGASLPRVVVRPFLLLYAHIVTRLAPPSQGAR